MGDLSKLYIERRIRVNDELLSESELLLKAKLIVVLAEPGAGKTEFLTHIASVLGVDSVRAARFRTPSYIPNVGSLVIDAMDEVARVSESELNDIIEKASRHHSCTTIFASRSGEWETARTKFIKECFHIEPTLVRIEAFNAAEQQLLFEHTFPDEDFERFSAEADQFDLTPLLGNPEFLKLFGYAFLENNRRFTSKTQIYEDAARRLASESNDGRLSRGRPEASLITRQASSVLARLLLSGASGISRKEKLDDQNFPYEGIVDAEVSIGINYLLDSKLFKPGHGTNEHEPVHRIVAEYLAAKYLTSKVTDPSDRFTMDRCLAIVAPNKVVRDELRGLLGWMAALGDSIIQTKAISIDPYAVLSNGDPSNLLTANRTLLIEQLKKVSETDPYFRRSDIWRSFNVGQFFSDDTVEPLRSILCSQDKSHLRGLVLELIDGSAIVARLIPDLEDLVLNASASDYNRISSFDVLRKLETYDPTHLFEPLLAESSVVSLRILTKLVLKNGVFTITNEKVLKLLGVLPLLYTDQRGRRSDGMSRYFLKEFFRDFPLDNIEFYLDDLSSRVTCSCGPDQFFTCHCRNGLSKIVGSLLDRYFLSKIGPYEPRRIWAWTKELRFRGNRASNDVVSVRVLGENAGLRQAIQQEAYKDVHTIEASKEVSMKLFGGGHSGLAFDGDDIAALARHVFEQDRTTLWGTFLRQHNVWSQKPTKDLYRTSLRSMAREKRNFMRVWAQSERSAKEWRRTNRKDFASRHKRFERREAEIRQKNFKYINDNRAKIEAGQHWSWMLNFANYFLHFPEKLWEIVDDTQTAHKAILNCIPLLSPHIPTLNELSQNTGSNIAMVLYAHCVLLWRRDRSLNALPLSVLQAVKTECSKTQGVDEKEAIEIECEIDRIIFAKATDIEKFARDLIEPALSSPSSQTSRINWLSYKKPFADLLDKLPLEWLQRFPDMHYDAETTLFGIAAQRSPRHELRALIAERVKRYLPDLPDDASDAQKQRRKYWLINSFYHDDDPAVWEALKSDKDNLLLISGRTDRFSRDDDEIYPPLSAEKIYKVIDTFIGEWPQVELPNGGGTSDPPEVHAYRFITESPWQISRDKPDDALPVLERMLLDNRFAAFKNDLLAAKANTVRKQALDSFYPPSPAEISALFEKKTIVSVEDMRALLLEMLTDLETQIRYSSTDIIDTFYQSGTRVDENTARNRIVDHIRLQMQANNMSVEIEAHMADSNRCDITAASVISGKRRLLVVEVKGQWHPELFRAASTQLNSRYSVHPDAERQGIYLVLWFGPEEKVAGLANTDYETPEKLKEAIINAMPSELYGRIDVHVMDLSSVRKLSTNVKPKSKTSARKKGERKSKSIADVR